MMGMDYLRLNRILAKPRDVPELTKFDRRLLRFIVIGAIVFVAAVTLVGILYGSDDRGYDGSKFDELSIFLLFILPIGLLLVLWWTTDVAPVFARVSIVVLALVVVTLAALFAVDTPWPSSSIFLLFAMYMLTVSAEAVLQIRRAGATRP